MKNGDIERVMAKSPGVATWLPHWLEKASAPRFTNHRIDRSVASSRICWRVPDDRDRPHRLALGSQVDHRGVFHPAIAAIIFLLTRAPEAGGHLVHIALVKAEQRFRHHRNSPKGPRAKARKAI
jgi:hypothetical protein